MVWAGSQTFKKITICFLSNCFQSTTADETSNQDFLCLFVHYKWKRFDTSIKRYCVLLWVRKFAVRSGIVSSQTFYFSNIISLRDLERALAGKIKIGGLNVREHKGAVFVCVGRGCFDLSALASLTLSKKKKKKATVDKIVYQTSTDWWRILPWARKFPWWSSKLQMFDDESYTSDSQLDHYSLAWGNLLQIFLIVFLLG